MSITLSRKLFRAAFQGVACAIAIGIYDRTKREEFLTKIITKDIGFWKEVHAKNEEFYKEAHMRACAMEAQFLERMERLERSQIQRHARSLELMESLEKQQ
jgi:hypothetical protein